MKSIITYFLIILFYTITSCQNSQKIYPGKIWNDNNGIHINAHGGGILFYENQYYWYGEHKISGSEGNKAQVGVHLYSSQDLYNWMDEGIVLKVIENDASHDITQGCILERPKVIYNKSTGKFIMYFHLELKGKGYDAARAGLATADNPKGPFTFVKSFRPSAGHWPLNDTRFQHMPVADTIKDKYCGGYGCLPAHPDSLNLVGRDHSTGQMARDMTLFVDDDGKAYHIFSSEENSTLHIAELTEDYMDYTGKWDRFFVNRYYEAPAIFKSNEGTYFIIGSDCTGWAPNAARSAKAKSIWGPWEELGNPCIGNGADLTFHSQSTYILPVAGKKNAFIFMADRWNPKNPIDGRYVWLPIDIIDEKLTIGWYDDWDLNYFKN